MNPPPQEPPVAAGNPHDEVNATTIVRLPWPVIVRDNIELWFIQIDHWFTVNRITSDNTRFSTIVAALDSNLLQQIYETIRNPPATGKYEAVKNAVIRNFTESEQRRAQQLVSGLQLGDKKPSHLLNDLRRMGGENQDEKLLKVLWLNRLPVQVQTCLAASTSSLNDLAQLADSVMETFRVSEPFQINSVRSDNEKPSSNVAAASNSNAAANNDSDLISKLATQIDKLTRQIASLQSGKSSSQRGPSNNRSRQRSRSATPMNRTSNEDDSLCWYHRNYGKEAHKCREPCDFQKN